MEYWVKEQKQAPVLPYRKELAHMMWTKEVNGKQIQYSHDGSMETLRDDGYIMIWYPKWNDPSWPEHTGDQKFRYSQDGINCFLDHRVNSYRVMTNHRDALAVDRRAFYRFIAILAETLASQISEDHGQSWLTVAEFRLRHAKEINMSYSEAMKQSISEFDTADETVEPMLEFFGEHYVLGGLS
ncbi:MAG: hypothetical protein LKJ69_10780 [Lactobacillus sp.]|jgi:hypothetical protein|nr:hypothetical protein [Lactobacillus sp.]